MTTAETAKVQESSQHFPYKETFERKNKAPKLSGLIQSEMRTLGEGRIDIEGVGIYEFILQLRYNDAPRSPPSFACISKGMVPVYFINSNGTKSS